MRIVIAPDPVLREVCTPVESIDHEIRSLAKQMGKLMYKNRGVGLAAPQVGETMRMFVFDVSPEDAGHNLNVCINPEFTYMSDETEEMDEGCLSIPGCSFKVRRHTCVSMRCLDEHGNEQVYDHATGLLAQCLQHEYDHLDGKTIFEDLDPIARIDALRTYREALARGAKPGDVD